MKSFISIILLSFFTVFSPCIFAQELPPIEIFTPEDYRGENQNWMISQASNKYIYIANSGGLLEFNGDKWKMYPSPNNSVIRAVNVIKDRVYTGSFEDFGYWKKDSVDQFQYHSLVDNLKNKSLADENIWNILTYQEWVIFQSQQNIYLYNTLNESFNIINSNNIITKIFNINKAIYYHVTNEGLYKIEQGNSKLVSNETIIKNDRVINIYTINNQIFIQTHKSGIYLLKNGKLSIWETPINNFIKSMSIFNSIQLEDGSFVLGTISNGIILLNSEGEVLNHINQKNGLSNNTALSLFEDKDKNVWVGLDNGINCINIKSPIKIFNDDEGLLGTVYASIVFKNYLYLGTNQGLFYKKLDSDEDHFQFINGTAGQVWSLFVFENNELLCGHHTGTYLIDKDKVFLVSNIPGAWGFKPIPNTKNFLLQGNYNGLYILKKEGGTWFLKNKIKGFDNSARYFEINKSNYVWVSHGYKGVFKLMLDDSFTKITSVNLEPGLLIGKNTSLVKYKGDILYANKKGIYLYDTIARKFIYDSIYSQIIESKKYMSAKLVASKKEKLWAFSKENINYLSTDGLTNKPKMNQIPIPFNLRKGMVGYEDITLIKDKEYLLGTTNGYLTIDLSKTNYTNEYNVILNSVNLKNVKNEITNYNSIDKGEFNYKSGVISFNYSVPEYDKYLVTKFRYKLEGHFNKWSDWAEKSETNFENPSFGDYTFNVQAKIGNKLSKNTSTYSFKVNKPWYLSNISLIGYLVVFSLVVMLIHRAYRKYYNKQNVLKQSVNEELIVRIKNDKLKQEIESKNRELAISTMSIIKKNEVLSSIKKELKNISCEPKEASPIIKLIDKNINNVKDWKFFEDAFNNADKHFLDKVKNSHPNLSPNDLRFCAYLRLNLSSKEIAPLLNISVRSVEIKRYRLRKKMNLAHDENLINHILEI
ncbi:MAG: LuxR family transcriptional regulator [Flavobacteriaceae bacterium]|nr:LuxR family transcriptional regulator [Flavobacteriaceae bacterium]